MANPTMAQAKKGQRTILGFDFGTKRIGIAIAQEVTGTANPLTTINAVKNKPDWDSISKIINEWQPDLFIVGLPSTWMVLNKPWPRQQDVFPTS